MPPSAALPPGWRVQTSRSSGEEYYVNEHTEESQYEVPTGPAPGAPAAAAPSDEPPVVEPAPAPAPRPVPAALLPATAAPPAAAAPRRQLPPAGHTDNDRRGAPEPVSMTADEIRDLQLLDQREADRRALPAGWERCRSSETGQVYYINKHTHTRHVEFPLKPARSKKSWWCCSSRSSGEGQQRRRPNSNEDDEATRLAHQEANLRPLPEGWERVRASETGETYFLNTVTHRRVREFPTQRAASGTAQGGGCCSNKPPKPTVKTLSQDVHHLKVQVDDLYRQLSTQHHMRIEQWSRRFPRLDALRTKRRVYTAWSRYAARAVRTEGIVERMTGGRSKHGAKVRAFGRWVAMWRHAHRIDVEERTRELERVTHSVRGDVDERLAQLEQAEDGRPSARRNSGRLKVMEDDRVVQTHHPRRLSPARRSSPVRLSPEAVSRGDVVVRRRRVVSPQPEDSSLAQVRVVSSRVINSGGDGSSSPLGRASVSDANRMMGRAAATAAVNKVGGRRVTRIISPERAPRSRLLQRRMKAARGGSDDDDGDYSSSSSDSEGENSQARARRRARNTRGGGVATQQQRQQRDSPHQLLQQMRRSPAATPSLAGRRRRP
jgi:hypothetical protein